MQPDDGGWAGLYRSTPRVGLDPLRAHRRRREWSHCRPHQARSLPSPQPNVLAREQRRRSDCVRRERSQERGHGCIHVSWRGRRLSQCFSRSTPHPASIPETTRGRNLGWHISGSDGFCEGAARPVVSVACGRQSNRIATYYESRGRHSVCPAIVTYGENTYSERRKFSKSCTCVAFRVLNL